LREGLPTTPAALIRPRDGKPRVLGIHLPAPARSSRAKRFRLFRCVASAARRNLWIYLGSFLLLSWITNAVRRESKLQAARISRRSDHLRRARSFASGQQVSASTAQ